MKVVKNITPREVTMVIKEASLIHYFSNCNELIGCEELFHFDKKVYIILEYMDQGSMKKIIRN